MKHRMLPKVRRGVGADEGAAPGFAGGAVVFAFALLVAVPFTLYFAAKVI